MEWIQFIPSLIGVIVGSIMTISGAIFLEKRKEIVEVRRTLKFFYIELNDYLSDAPNYVEEVISSYKKIKQYKLGIVKDKIDVYPMVFPPQLNFLTMDNLFEKAFSELTMDQRKAIKAIKTLSKEINTRSYNIGIIKDVDNISPEEILSIAKMCSSFYYLVSRLCNEKERFTFYNESSEEIEQKGLDALGLKYDFNTLINMKA